MTAEEGAAYVLAGYLAGCVEQARGRQALPIDHVQHIGPDNFEVTFVGGLRVAVHIEPAK